MMFDIIVAIITPFNKDNKVNYIELKRLIKDLSLNNLTGILLTGTTGEFFSLTNEEKKEIYKFVKSLDETKNLKIYANVGTNNTLETIKFIKEIEDINLDGYMVCCPYYLLLDQESLYEHFKNILTSTKKDIIIYNTKERCNVEINIDYLKKLEQFKNLYAIKECSFDLVKLKAMKENLNIKIYTGNDTLLYDAFKLKLDGIISAAANIYLPEINEIIYYDDYEKFKKYNKYFKNLFVKPNPVIIKNLLIQKDYDVGSVRLPLLDLSFYELECILKKFDIRNIKL